MRGGDAASLPGARPVQQPLLDVGPAFVIHHRLIDLSDGAGEVPPKVPILPRHRRQRIGVSANGEQDVAALRERIRSGIEVIATDQGSTLRVGTTAMP